MKNTLQTTLTVLGVITLAALLLLIGAWMGRTGTAMAGFGPGNMMSAGPGYGRGMMGDGLMTGGGGMMGGGMMNGGGMMSGGGMMGPSGLYEKSEPLTLAAAEQALKEFLTAEGRPELEIGEIMIFDNHAYAQIVEESTGIGAMEVLVDPVTLAVYPEHGPNMMWNLKYGMMMGAGGQMMDGGMMGSYANLSLQPADVSAEMPVTPAEALESAQDYLDVNLPGTQADDHADPFYGYYTLHVLRDGEVVGMLSVNGYTRQVFLHSWHGDFVEMGGE